MIAWTAATATARRHSSSYRHAAVIISFNSFRGLYSNCYFTRYSTYSCGDKIITIWARARGRKASQEASKKGPRSASGTSPCGLCAVCCACCIGIAGDTATQKCSSPKHLRRRVCPAATSWQPVVPSTLRDAGQPNPCMAARGSTVSGAMATTSFEPQRTVADVTSGLRCVVAM